MGQMFFHYEENLIVQCPETERSKNSNSDV
jgi:hypothetical protein